MQEIKICSVAIDVGGTFTDLDAEVVYTDNRREYIREKVNSTSPNYENGVLDVISKANISIEQISILKHGTTVGINAITQGNVAKVGLITSEGFRDTLGIATGRRPQFFNLDYEKPRPLVPRYLRREISGKISHKGEIVRPLDISKLKEIVSYFQNMGVEAIAVSTMNSYANPEHEIVIANEIEKLWPDISVVVSTQASNEAGEYARTSTAVLSAAIKPVVKNYLQRLSSKLKAKKFSGNIYIMKSNGGVDTIDGILRSPINIVESGPAAGFMAASKLSEQVIGFDVGGTTVKLTLSNRRLSTISQYNILSSKTSPGYPILTPVIDITEIGNGGGSIAYVDEFKRLHVGPRSAGAIPGPVSYGKGGTEITTTDACLALGWINSEDFCGGGKADMDSVYIALNKLADQIGISQTINNRCKIVASKVLQIAQNNMLKMLKSASIDRGHDPRKFTLVAFGGGGGIHASFLAEKLGIKNILIPSTASVFSASGMRDCSLRRDFSHTRIINLTKCKVTSELYTELSTLRSKALATYITEGFPEDLIELNYFLNIRYIGQGHSVEIALNIHELNLDSINKAFTEAYKNKYTYTLDQEVELVSLRIQADIKSDLQTKCLGNFTNDITVSATQRRIVDFFQNGNLISVEADVYKWGSIPTGINISGPAVIEGSGNTVLILPNMLFYIDVEGNINIKPGVAYEHALCSSNSVETIAIDNKITMEIIQESWDEISRQMFDIMKLTAQSPIIYKVLDMSTGITDSGGNLLSSGAGMPAFAGLLDFPIKAIIRSCLTEDINSGDIFILNCPYSGGVTHLNDVIVAMPVFDSTGTIVSSTGVIAHQSDIGGIAKGSLSTNAKFLCEEGMRLLPTKLFTKGSLATNVMEHLRDGSRMPDTLEADIMAAVAAVRNGAESIKKLLQEFGKKIYLRAIDEYFIYGNDVTQQGLKSLPLGKFSLTEQQDQADQVFSASVEIREDRSGKRQFEVDLVGMPEQSDGPDNLSRDAAIVAARIVLKSLTSPDTVCNSGTFQSLCVKTRPGSMFQPNVTTAGKLPAMGFYFETFMRLHDLIWKVLAVNIPDRLPAGSFSSICGTLYGDDQHLVVEPKEGGWGASQFKDGNSAIFSPFHGDTEIIGAEWMEALYGVEVLRYSFNPDHGGEGQHRGGKGILVEMRMLSMNSWATMYYTRSVVPPWGLEGGNNGSLNYVEVIRYDSQIPERYSKMTDVKLRINDILRIVTGNGAGYGDAILRDPEYIELDLKNEFISKEVAETVYGFFVKPISKSGLIITLNKFIEKINNIQQQYLSSKSIYVCNLLKAHLGQNRLLAGCRDIFSESMQDDDVGKDNLIKVHRLLTECSEGIDLEKSNLVKHLQQLKGDLLSLTTTEVLQNKSSNDSCIVLT